MKYKGRRQVIFEYLIGEGISKKKARKISKKIYFKSEADNYLKQLKKLKT